MQGSIRWRRMIAVSLLLLLVAAGVEAQNQKKNKKSNSGQPADLVQMYQRGAYKELVDTVQASPQPSSEALYMQALGLDGLKDSARSTQVYGALATQGESDAWRAIGESAQAVRAGDLARALTAADRAVVAAPGNKYAHYQRGWVLLNQRNYQRAAESFVKLLEIDGNYAYGHYYAGVCFNHLRSLSAMAQHWERFLQLAPEAPERAQVEAVMLSIRS